MPTLVGFGTFAALPEEQISEKISRRILSGDQGMIVWWSIGAGVHVEPHSHANEGRSSSIARKNLPAASEQNHLCRIHNTRRATERWARGGPSEYWDASSARHLPRPDEVPAGVCGRIAGRVR